MYLEAEEESVSYSQACQTLDQIINHAYLQKKDEKRAQTAPSPSKVYLKKLKCVDHDYCHYIRTSVQSRAHMPHGHRKTQKGSKFKSRTLSVIPQIASVARDCSEGYDAHIHTRAHTHTQKRTQRPPGYTADAH